MSIVSTSDFNEFVFDMRELLYIYFIHLYIIHLFYYTIIFISIFLNSVMSLSALPRVLVSSNDVPAPGIDLLRTK